MDDSTTTLHRYRLLDPETGDWVVQLSKRTEDQIKAMDGRIIPGTAELVPVAGANNLPDDSNGEIAAPQLDHRDFSGGPIHQAEDLQESSAPHVKEPAQVSFTDLLKQSAISIFNGMRDRKSNLQSEYDDLQSNLAYRKIELDAQVEILSTSYARMLNYKPTLGTEILCPRCWVVNGKKAVAVKQDGVLRCGGCHQEYSAVAEMPG